MIHIIQTNELSCCLTINRILVRLLRCVNFRKMQDFVSQLKPAMVLRKYAMIDVLLVLKRIFERAPKAGSEQCTTPVKSPVLKGIFSTHVEAETIMSIEQMSFFAILSETLDKNEALVANS